MKIQYNQQDKNPSIRDSTRISAKSARKAHYDLRKEKKEGKRARAQMEWCA